MTKEKLIQPVDQRNAKAVGSIIINDIFYFLTFFILFLDLIQLDYSKGNSLVLFSFFVNGLLFCFFSVLFKNKLTHFKIVQLFNIIFFFIAPFHQYLSGTVFWTSWGLNIVYTDRDYFVGNVYVFFFSIMFFASYFFSKQKELKTTEEKQVQRIRNPLPFFIFTTISVLILSLTGNLFSSHYFLPSSFRNLESQIDLMLLVVPVNTYVLFRFYYYGKNRTICLLILLTVSLLCFSPFAGDKARFLLFSIYIILGITTFPSIKRYPGLVSFLIIFGFFFLFSNSRHNASLNDWFAMPDFNYVDYDAYQIFLLSMKYTDANGICFGGNIFSALLFLIPRFIFPFKMIGSGTIFALFYGSNFENVSAPVFAECYFALGPLFSMILPYFLGKLFNFLEINISSRSNPYLFLFSNILFGMLIYICRGSLLASIAFFGAVILSSIIEIFIFRCQFVNVRGGK